MFRKILIFVIVVVVKHANLPAFTTPAVVAKEYDDYDDYYEDYYDYEDERDNFPSSIHPPNSISTSTTIQKTTPLHSSNPIDDDDEYYQYDDYDYSDYDNNDEEEEWEDGDEKVVQLPPHVQIVVESSDYSDDYHSPSL